MPIHIKLVDLGTVIFQLDDTESFNKTLAKQRFYDALINYCDGLGCTEPGTDLGLP